MGFFDLLNSVDDNNEDDDLEQRMEDLDLEEWQKELVREGKYDPENFEESEDLEEDDYYSEDDE
jgi:hypothetical protein